MNMKKTTNWYEQMNADKRTINTFGHSYLNGAGVRPQTPGEAPPLAGFNLNISGCIISQPSILAMGIEKNR
jgi:hypothetical protein